MTDVYLRIRAGVSHDVALQHDTEYVKKSCALFVRNLHIYRNLPLPLWLKIRSQCIPWKALTISTSPARPCTMPKQTVKTDKATKSGESSKMPPVHMEYIEYDPQYPMVEHQGRVTRPHNPKNAVRIATMDENEKPISFYISKTVLAEYVLTSQVYCMLIS